MTTARTLTAVGLHRRFRRRVVVHDLHLSVSPGEIVGLLGANGAGKTTTFRILAGLLRPHGGAVRLGGREITRLPLWRRARLGLGYLPQRSTLLGRLTVAENVALGFARRMPSADRHERLTRLLSRFGLSALAAARGHTLSGGERRRAEVARALAADPAFLMMDEPFAGLDPRAAGEAARLVRDLVHDGVGVILTDHHGQRALEACDRAYVLEAGHLLAEGRPETLAADPRVQAAWLGTAPIRDTGLSGEGGDPDGA